jgi:phosphorylated CTD-interacting factor 1
LKKGDRINIENQQNKQDDHSHNNGNIEVVTILYTRKKWKKPFCFKINRKHYQNLKERFVRIHDSTRHNNPSTASHWPPSFIASTKRRGGGSSDIMIERSFHVIILALLLRYSALSGGQLLDDLRGGGMQGAIHSEVFHALQSHFSKSGYSFSSQSWLEGFASPFNATLPYFSSAFPELDWHFGSVGSFFDCKFETRGSDDEFCEANPPFTPGIMEGMADHMFKSLQGARDNSKQLTFIVVVPSADADKKKPSMSLNNDEHVVSAVKKAAFNSFQSMVSSTFCTKHIRLGAREHGYVEGSQHLRPTMFKQSSYDTSVIILQSMRSKGETSDGKNLGDLEKKVRSAFKSRHEEEISSRKRKMNYDHKNQHYNFLMHQSL